MKHSFMKHNLNPSGPEAEFNVGENNNMRDN